jgi:hypothetical protein
LSFSTEIGVSRALGVISSPRLIVGEQVVILDAAARLGHHIGHRIAPPLVMSGLFVLAGIFLGPVNFDQYRICVASRLF